MSIVGSMKMYWRFAWDLRKFLKEPITLEQSHKIIRQRMREREQNLLGMAKRAIFFRESFAGSNIPIF